MAGAREGVALLLVRHGQQVRVGDDGPLTPLGQAQAAALRPAVRLGEDDRLVSSPLLRARETAAALGRVPELVGDLAEFRFGPTWEWERADRHEDRQLWRPEDRLVGGESLRAFHLRVEGALQGLVRATPGGRVVAVVHSGVIAVALRWAFGVSADVPWTTDAEGGHASLTELVHWPAGRDEGGAPRHTLLVRVGDVGHLPPGQRSD